MTDVSRHEAEHAAGHGPPDPNDGVVRARPPSPRAFALAAAVALLTVLGLAVVAAASGRGL